MAAKERKLKSGSKVKIIKSSSAAKLHKSGSTLSQVKNQSTILNHDRLKEISMFVDMENKKNVPVRNFKSTLGSVTVDLQSNPKFQNYFNKKGRGATPIDSSNTSETSKKLDKDKL